MSESTYEFAAMATVAVKALVERYQLPEEAYEVATNAARAYLESRKSDRPLNTERE